jgi:hypothetical protein
MPVIDRIQNTLLFFVERSPLSGHNYFYWVKVVGIVEEKRVATLINCSNSFDVTPRLYFPILFFISDPTPTSQGRVFWGYFF